MLFWLLTFLRWLKARITPDSLVYIAELPLPAELRPFADVARIFRFHLQDPGRVQVKQIQHWVTERVRPRAVVEMRFDAQPHRYFVDVLVITALRTAPSKNGNRRQET